MVQRQARYRTAGRGPDGAARSSAAYYGQLARARLGLRTLALATPPAAPDRRAGVERLELVRAVEILYALEERSLVIPLMADVGDKLDDVGALSALGELAERYQDARGMLQLGKAALARGLPLDYYAFPTVGVPRYSPVAPAIDSALLFAIIRQESAFNPADLSSANAMGLMQVTPLAARDTCKRFSSRWAPCQIADLLSMAIGATMLLKRSPVIHAAIMNSFQCIRMRAADASARRE